MSEALSTTALTSTPPTTISPLAGLVSRQTMAETIGCNWRTLLRYEHAGMPSIKVFGEVYYDPSKVTAWIADRAPKRACNREPVRRGRPAKQVAA